MFLNPKKHLGARLTHTWVWWKHRCPLSNLIPNCIYRVSPKTECKRKGKWVGLFIARETDKEAQIPSLFQRGQPDTLAPGSFKRRRALGWRQFFMKDLAYWLFSYLTYSGFSMRYEILSESLILFLLPHMHFSKYSDHLSASVLLLWREILG